MATDNELIQQLYVAFFQRPADVAGLEFWSNALDAGSSLSGISAEFARQNEYRNKFTGLTPAQSVDLVFMNLVGRHADSGGLACYSHALEQGATTLASIVRDAAAGAQGNDAEYFQNKVVAAEISSMMLTTDDAARLGYASGAAPALAAGRAYVDSVTTDSSLQVAIEGLDNIIVTLGTLGVPL